LKTSAGASSEACISYFPRDIAGMRVYTQPPDAQSRPIRIDNVEIYGRSMSPKQDFVVPISA
jgi:hypothetical protein